MDLKNKVVIVIGASSGIGAASAVQFGQEGARVVLVGRDITKLQATAALCKETLIITADITNENDVRRVIATTIDKFGQIDVLVNSAGISAFQTLKSSDLLTVYDNIMNINFRAIVHLTSLAAPHLIKTKGNIVNISSIAGVTPIKNLTIYGTAKAALIQFGACTAEELAPHGVRVNTVSPGPVNTDFIKVSKFGDEMLKEIKNMTPLKKFAEPEEIAYLVVFLASGKAKSITGSNYILDNGFLVKI